MTWRTYLYFSVWHPFLHGATFRSQTHRVSYLTWTSCLERDCLREELYHGAGVCVFLSELQSQVWHGLRHALYRHRLVVGEPMVLQQAHTHTKKTPNEAECPWSTPTFCSMVVHDYNSLRVSNKAEACTDLCFHSRFVNKCFSISDQATHRATCG